jgi:cytochrome c biogenesis protein CcmG, thiol:disulfide interchange protein DsbE
VTDRPGFEHRRERRGLIGPFGGRQLLGGLVVIVVVAVLLVVVTTPLGSGTGIQPGNPQPTQYVIGPAVANGLRPGDVPPELTITGPDGQPTPLLDLNGKPVKLAALRGKAVWLNFWASWCPPCQFETPVLRDVSDAYRDRGLEVVGVSVRETSADDVRAYVAKYGLGYAVAADVTGAVYDAYRLNGIPTSFFIGPAGAIHSIVNGPLTESAARAQVESLLGSVAAPSGSSGPPGSSPSPAPS